MSILAYLMDFAYSAVPGAVFAMLFGTPLRYIPYAALGGAVAHLTRTVCLNNLELGIVAASFIASTVISVMFILIASRLKVPRLVFTVASIIPIIPGKYAYFALLSIIQMHVANETKSQFVETFFENGIITLFVMLAIGMGIAMPALLFYRNRPVV